MQSVTIRFHREPRHILADVLSGGTTLFRGSLKATATWLNNNGFTYIHGSNGTWSKH